AMEKQNGSNGDVLSIGLDNGEIWGLDRSGNMHKIDKIDSKITAIQYGYIGTDKGLYAQTWMGSRLQVLSTGVTALYGAGSTLLVGLVNDSVYSVYNFNQLSP